jgi:hypothetical protein
MKRKILFPLAAGIVGLVAISPALANESKAPGKSSPPAKGSAPAKNTTTSTTRSDPGASGDSGSAPDGGGSTGNDNNNGSAGNPGPGSGGAPRSSTVCDPPETNQGPAPQMGDAPQTFESGEAGSVDIERLSDTELRVVKATPNDGWTEQVAAPSGPRVTVKFTRQGSSPTLIRFAASMDQKGTMIHTRVTNCG